MKIVLILISLSLTGYASACSCMKLTSDEKIAKADFHVRVEVLDSGTVSGMLRMYKIRLIATYKSDGNPSIRINDRFIYTQQSSSACGTTLRQGRYYNLTGFYQTASVMVGFWRCGLESRMHISMCGLISPRPDYPIPPLPGPRPSPPFPWPFPSMRPEFAEEEPFPEHLSKDGQ